LNQQPDQRQTSLRGQHRCRYGPGWLRHWYRSGKPVIGCVASGSMPFCRSWWSRLSTTATCSWSSPCGQGC
jgi:hypothetical protein